MLGRRLHSLHERRRLLSIYLSLPLFPGGLTDVRCVLHDAHLMNDNKWACTYAVLYRLLAFRAV